MDGNESGSKNVIKTISHIYPIVKNKNGRQRKWIKKCDKNNITYIGQLKKMNGNESGSKNVIKNNITYIGQLNMDANGSGPCITYIKQQKMDGKRSHFKACEKQYQVYWTINRGVEIVITFN